MTPCKKSDILKILESLPDHTTVEDVMERIFMLGKIQKGLLQVKSGSILSHGAVKERMAKWL